MEQELFDDEDLAAQITRELAELNVDSQSDDASDSPDAGIPDAAEMKIMLPETKSLEVFQHRLTTQRQDFEKQLEECAKLLHSTDGMLLSLASFH